MFYYLYAHDKCPVTNQQALFHPGRMLVNDRALAIWGVKDPNTCSAGGPSQSTSIIPACRRLSPVCIAAWGSLQGTASGSTPSSRRIQRRGSAGSRRGGSPAPVEPTQTPNRHVRSSRLQSPFLRGWGACTEPAVNPATEAGWYGCLLFSRGCVPLSPAALELPTKASMQVSGECTAPVYVLYGCLG